MGLSAEDKKDMREMFNVFEEKIDDKFERLARMVQAGFQDASTKAETRSEFERVHERLNELEDIISYQKGRDDLIEKRIDKVEGRVLVLEAKR